MAPPPASRSTWHVLPLPIPAQYQDRFRRHPICHAMPGVENRIGPRPGKRARHAQLRKCLQQSNAADHSSLHQAGGVNVVRKERCAQSLLRRRSAPAATTQAAFLTLPPRAASMIFLAPRITSACGTVPWSAMSLSAARVSRISSSTASNPSRKTNFNNALGERPASMARRSSRF